VFKTKTKSLHLKTRRRPKPFCDVYSPPTEKQCSFSAGNENADEKDIPLAVENETKTKMDIGVEDYINDELKGLSIRHLLQFLLHSNYVLAIQHSSI